MRAHVSHGPSLPSAARSTTRMLVTCARMREKAMAAPPCPPPTMSTSSAFDPSGACLGFSHGNRGCAISCRSRRARAVKASRSRSLIALLHPTSPNAAIADWASGSLVLSSVTAPQSSPAKFRRLLRRRGDLMELDQDRAAIAHDDLAVDEHRFDVSGLSPMEIGGDRVVLRPQVRTIE